MKIVTGLIAVLVLALIAIALRNWGAVNQATPIDLFVPEPGPLESTSGVMPATSAIVVIRIGRSRSRLAWMIASMRSMPCRRNPFV